MQSLEERFWAKVEKTDGCWIWIGSWDPHGYGKIQRGGRSGGIVKAHRLSYELHHGPIPDGLFVLHRCDNPRCVNPEHLFVGTHQDNMDDRKAKGRPFGRPFAVDPDELIAYVNAGNSYRATAAHFGVPTSTVYRCLKRNGLVRTVEDTEAVAQLARVEQARRRLDRRLEA